MLRRVDAGLATWPEAGEEEGLVPEGTESVDVRGNALEDAQGLLRRLPASVRAINLAGNKLKRLDAGLLPRALETLHLGGNFIEAIDGELPRTLRVLYLGGNRLREVPAALLQPDSALEVLYLNSNELASLPIEMVRLSRLEALHLQYNRLEALPVELLALKRLRTLTVRGNPLLRHFADEFVPTVPSLKELAARSVRGTGTERLPGELRAYLSTAHVCVGCRRTSFVDAERGPPVKSLIFADLCGSVHVPFQQFLCSSRCSSHRDKDTTDSNGDADADVRRLARLRKILLDAYNPEASASEEDLRRELVRNMAEEDGGMD